MADEKKVEEETPVDKEDVKQWQQALKDKALKLGVIKDDLESFLSSELAKHCVRPTPNSKGFNIFIKEGLPALHAKLEQLTFLDVLGEVRTIAGTKKYEKEMRAKRKKACENSSKKVLNRRRYKTPK